MSLEDQTALLNASFFLPEFTFLETTFTPKSGTEVELADGLVCLEDQALIFQMKERHAPNSGEQRTFERWFEAKVLRKATRQIRDSLCYLEQHRSLQARNIRGQLVELSFQHVRCLQKIIVYSGEESSKIKHHISRSAGFIHILEAGDYALLVSTLATLAEVFEYLVWRERVIRSFTDISELPEKALLGNFLWGDPNAMPSQSDARFVLALQQNVNEWDMSGILQRFLERSYLGAEGINYHRVIAEVAKLNRNGLRAFKERFALAMQKSSIPEFTLPYRFSMPSTGCGFIFIPLEERVRENRLIALQNFTAAHKYVERLDRCLGLTFLADPDGMYTVDWCIQDFPWSPDEEMNTLLSQVFPFRETASKSMKTYHFDPKLV